MADSSDFQNAPNQNNGYSSDFDYIMKAVAAYEAGDMVLAMHLYLAAYEAASADPTIPRTAAVRSLREAWNLACELKERSMAEYVFEKLEPFLSGDELATCANRLQQLALDRLAEYGFSRDELEGMADMISEELLGNGSPFIQVEHMSVPSSRIGGMPFEVSVVHPANLHSDGLDAVLPVADANAADAQDAPGDDVPELDNAQLSMFEAQETLDEQTQGDDLFGSGVQEQAEEQAQVQAEGQQAMLPAAGLGSLAVSPAMPGREIQAGQMPSMPAPALDVPRDDVLTYHNLRGYDDSVDLMRTYG
ncbi:MAG: hypothetical protein IJH04_06935, partial [Eggerthellaceae bacterium]|nr:hypothetical protein [Eggerthellaceae bacterium]